MVRAEVKGGGPETAYIRIGDRTVPGEADVGAGSDRSDGLRRFERTDIVCSYDYLPLDLVKHRYRIYRHDTVRQEMPPRAFPKSI